MKTTRTFSRQWSKQGTRPGRWWCVLVFGLAMLMLGSILIPVVADDWPQLHGPRQDCTSIETGLVNGWDKNGPPVLWKVKVGEGYSAPVIVGDKLIIFHRVSVNEVIDCLDATTGKKMWTAKYRCTYEDSYGKGNGPRSTPVIANDKVITLGAEGWLQCTNLNNGERIWGRSITQDYQVPENFFGVGTSPVVAGNLLLVNVGGRKNAGIVAFQLETGKEVWKTTTDGASYSTPVLTKQAGKSIVVFLTRQGVVLLEPGNGNVFHHQRWRSRIDASVNAASPLVIGNLLFFSASYGTGALLLRIDGDKVSEVWKSEDAMSNHYNTCVHHDGCLYGIDGRQELRANLRCIELQTGKVRWTKEGFRCASLLLADGKLFCLTEDGELVLLEPNAKEYTELARAKSLRYPPCRANLALSNGRLFGRDGTMLVCWNVKK